MRGFVWGQGPDGQAARWDLTFRVCPLPPCDSLSAAAPLLESLGPPPSPVPWVSPPVFLRPTFPLLCQAPASPEPQREDPACLQGPSWGGGARAGTLRKPDGSPPPPLTGSSSGDDRVILPFVASLTEVRIYLPFSRSLCLDFGQTTNNAPHSNSSICGMCGLACPVPGPRKAQVSPPRGPRPCPLQLPCRPLVLTQGPAATSLLSSVLMSF